jgi:hypothetical protein
MSISFIVILGLPVLFLTGSLKKAVFYTGARRLVFLLYFACTAGLSFIPAIRLAQGLRLSVAGTFFCVAPAVYLAVKKQFTYGYYLGIVLTVLFAVALSFFSNTYAMPYLPYLTGLAASVAASVCFKSKGAVFAPVMTGVYGAAGGLMQLFSGMDNSFTLFGNIDIMSLCAAMSLFISYLARPRGRHSRGVLQAQVNKG